MPSHNTKMPCHTCDTNTPWNKYYTNMPSYSALSRQRVHICMARIWHATRIIRQQHAYAKSQDEDAMSHTWRAYATTHVSHSLNYSSLQSRWTKHYMCDVWCSCHTCVTCDVRVIYICVAHSCHTCVTYHTNMPCHTHVCGMSHMYDTNVSHTYDTHIIHHAYTVSLKILYTSHIKCQ